MTSPIEYVEGLAHALDADDYETAAANMSDGVVYTIGDRVFEGPEAIVASYRESSQMARRLFDEVEYDHVVIATDDPNTFRVSYSDILTVDGDVLTHMAEQHLTVMPGAGVERIVNVEVVGERDRLDEFLKRHGLTRD